MSIKPKYTEQTAYCGKCGDNLLRTTFDKKHKPKFCRNCGEEINWAYLKDNAQLAQVLELNKAEPMPWKKLKRIELRDGIWRIDM